MTSHDLTEAKRLVVQSQTAHTVDDAIVNLTLAVNILIGLVEGHRHAYGSPFIDNDLTGPMQAVEGKS